MTTRTRLKPAVRKEDIIAHALKLAERYGYAAVTRAQIASKAGVAESLVSHYFGTMPQMRRDLMRHAIREGNLIVLAQGLADRNAYASRAPEDLRKRAVALILN